ncbi:MBL fold metallo-hydrolase, partial [Candidatus Omnitrophota bacterium]
MILETVCVGAYYNLANCYILAQDKSNQAIIIDPGDEPEKIKMALSRRKLNPAFIINTHGHIDHIGADSYFSVPIYIHKGDREFLSNPDLNLSGLLGTPLSIESPLVRMLEDGQELDLAGIKLRVLHTPGHTPGGICLLLEQPGENLLFSGDTLFCQGVGR